MRDQQLTQGNTDFSAHVATDIHEKKDLKFSVLCTEENWFKRGVKEAIAIKKLKPSLNKDQGRYHLSAIYDDFIRTSVTMSTTRTGEKDGTEETNFWGRRPTSSRNISRYDKISFLENSLSLILIKFDKDGNV